MIALKNVHFSYGYEPVFTGVTFAISKGKKVGIVGPNGAGKSTLLKLLTDQEYPTEGTIQVVGKLGHVPQEVNKDAELSAAKDLFAFIDPTGKAGKFRVTEILDGLEFDWRHADTKPSDMSGGQKTKLALARAFVAQPDILLLDEPTNFLDEAGKKWVMHFLGKYPKTVIVVSHDLLLLDKHIQQILYVNPQTKTVDVFSGNYSKFLKTKSQQDAFLIKQAENAQKKIAQLQKSADKLRRETSDKKIRQRIVIERRIERMQENLPPAPKELRSITVAFPPPLSVSEVPISAYNISKSFGSKHIFSDFSFHLERGERVALIGTNGVGKTTLIKTLTQTIKPDSGRVEHSDTLSLGYYSQEFQTFDDSLTLQEMVVNTLNMEARKVAPFLSRFLFSYDRLNQRVGTLSGGEKTRLSIALLMLKQHNVLILDEPTTYLDVMSQRIILEALKDYSGAMLLVSHTPEFVQELTPNRAIMLPEQKISFWHDEFLQEVIQS